MGPLLLALVLLIGLFLLLAFFARGGPTETIAPGHFPPELAGLGKLTLPELASVTSRLFSELGFQKSSQHERSDRIDMLLEDPTPITGHRAYVRCVLPSEAGAVQSAEVQAALDTARGEQLGKAIVVTSGKFSDEATLVSTSAPLELIDGAKLATLIRSYLPDVANRLGLPR